MRRLNIQCFDFVDFGCDFAVPIRYYYVYDFWQYINTWFSLIPTVMVLGLVYKEVHFSQSVHITFYIVLQ